jgi:hypothetical protein
MACLPMALDLGLDVSPWFPMPADDLTPDRLRLIGKENHGSKRNERWWPRLVPWFRVP